LTCRDAGLYVDDLRERDVLSSTSTVLRLFGDGKSLDSIVSPTRGSSVFSLTLLVFLIKIRCTSPTHHPSNHIGRHGRSFTSATDTVTTGGVRSCPSVRPSVCTIHWRRL